MAKKSETTLPKATKSALSTSKTQNGEAIKAITKKVEEYQTGNKPFEGITPPKRTLTPEEEDLTTTTYRVGGMEDLDYDGNLNKTIKDRAKENIVGKDGKNNEIFYKRAKLKNKLKKAAIELQGRYPVGKVDVKGNHIYSESVKVIKEVMDGCLFSEEITNVEELPNLDDLKYFVKSFAFLLPEGQKVKMSNFAKAINVQYSNDNPQVAEAVNTINRYNDVYFVMKEGGKVKFIIKGTNQEQKIEEADEFQSEPSIMSDFKGRDLMVSRQEDGTLLFDFDSSGWLFDTTDVAEGAAICAGSHFKDDEQLRQITITAEDKTNINPEDALYWLSGGNAMWRFGEVYEHNLNENENWKSVAPLLVEYFGGELQQIINNSNNLGDLMDAFGRGYEDEDSLRYKIYEDWSDFLLSNGIYVDEEDEENLGEGKTYAHAGEDKNKKLQQIKKGREEKKQKMFAEAVENEDAVLNSYLEAALWTAVNMDDENEEYLDANYSIRDFSEESIEKTKKDISWFINKAKPILDTIEIADDQLGHDLLLTRNGHGAGFWDRGLGEAGDDLSAIARTMGEVDIIVGDDGKVHLEGGKDLTESISMVKPMNEETEYPTENIEEEIEKKQLLVSKIDKKIEELGVELERTNSKRIYDMCQELRALKSKTNAEIMHLEDALTPEPVMEDLEQTEINKVIDTVGDENQVIVSKDQEGKQKIEVKDKPDNMYESIKQLNFGKNGFEFKNEEHAKSLIPEAYQVNGKVFNMTDGNQTFTFKWEKESFINEATLLGYENKQLIKENREKTFHLMGYKAPTTSLSNEAKATEKEVFVELFQKLNNEEETEI